MTRIAAPKNLFRDVAAGLKARLGPSRQQRDGAIDLLLDGETIRVAIVRRAAAKRLTLRLDASTRSVRLTAPARARHAALVSFVESQTDWIAARLSALPERIRLAPGSILPLRGVDHVVVQEPGRRSVDARSDPGSGVAVIRVSDDPALCTGRLRRFLVREAERDLRAAVDRYAGLVGASPTRITIRDTKSRWGSCSSAGALSFSWRLILAPSYVLDYLAAHEVAHLREMNHSPRYWALLRAACPETDRAETWLKRHGPSLHRYG